MPWRSIYTQRSLPALDSHPSKSNNSAVIRTPFQAPGILGALRSDALCVMEGCVTCGGVMHVECLENHDYVMLCIVITIAKDSDVTSRLGKRRAFIVLVAADDNGYSTALCRAKITGRYEINTMA